VRPIAFIGVLLAATSAAGDVGDTARSVGEVVGYTTPAIGAALTSVANGTALAYGGTSSTGWRVAGWICGGVELAIGTGMLLTYTENTTRVVLGVVPIVLGVAAVTTATFVDGEERPTTMAVLPWLAPGAGGAVVGGSF
jgi:hypothetical protein